MATEKKERRKLIRRLKSRYRLVILNEDTLEEKASFKLRPLNVFVTVGITVILLIVLTTILIAFTGLREYIPGYADVKMKRQMYNLMQKADSMRIALNARELYLDNLKNIINGNITPENQEKKTAQTNKFDTIKQLKKSTEDSLLRKEIETGDIYSLGVNKTVSSGISSFLFFPPIKGTVTNSFNTTGKHFGIDIVGNPNEAIKATLDGTVLLANFTSETGWVIGIQHSNNLFSLYKHNSVLLKKVGDFVKAGEVVAIIGNSGELTSGSHLHFELWYNGSAIDPQKYISF
jgi:murein DD-endopeptidase MepM/ murein hydrolase activator NlpD